MSASRGGGGQPTIADVARRAGVSTATVSRALNDPERVAVATRLEIRAAIRELGYTPHFGGRALASNRSHTIGAVIPTMENAIFARGMQAMEERLAASGVTLLIATSNYEPAREAAQIRALLARGVDGLAMIGEARAQETYGLLERRGVPYVLVWSWRANSPRPCIGFDNRAAARRIAERAIELGHREIAMIAGISRDNDRAAARIEGVGEALSAAGLSFDGGGPIEAPYDLDEGAAAARALFARPRPPSAILCGNDVLAAGACLAVRAAGLRAPADLSIAGFDDIELARVIDPPLTTMRAPHRRMGERAAEALLARIETGAPIESVAFSCELIERASLGPPSAR